MAENAALTTGGISPEVLMSFKTLLADALKGVESRLEARLQGIETQVTTVQKDLDTLKVATKELTDNMKDTRERLGRLERNVQAIESLPVPYGRPKVFQRGTEYQSVSGGRTKRLGHMT